MPYDNSIVIKDDDKFNPSDFPTVASELTALGLGISHIQAAAKSDMVISFVKDHCLRNEWVHNNPDITSLITARFFSITETENLFKACRANKIYLNDLENFVRQIIMSTHQNSPTPAHAPSLNER